ncbi:MAG: serine hydrolase [Chitinophagales bacterium]|nr:serine hydrolase [Chitinophagales bacterium]
MKYYLSILLLIVSGIFLHACAESPDVEKVQDGISDQHIRFAVDQIDNYYSDQYQRGKFNGNILIAYKGEIIYQKSMGWAVKSSGEKLVNDSKFQLASTSKPFTATAILLLYEKGKIGLDDDIRKYISNFPYKGITVRLLLSHQSGLPDYTDYKKYFKKKYIDNQDVIDMFVKYRPKIQSSPNTKFKYNNSNYVVLALLVEKISELSFSDFVEENIFKPLGMKNTWAWHPTQAKKEHQTYGYEGNWVLRQPDLFDGALGDKGIYSTTEDLLKWDQSWYNHTLLKPSTIKMAYTPQTDNSDGNNYGLGWRMKTLEDGKRLIYHNGWWHDYNLVFKRFVDDSVTIIILSNKLNMEVYHTDFVENVLLGPRNPDEEILPEKNYFAERKKIDNPQPFTNVKDDNEFSTLEEIKNSVSQSIAQSKYYIVKRGDTLYNIATRMNITVDMLKNLNKLKTATIFLGQRLIVN